MRAARGITAAVIAADAGYTDPVVTTSARLAASIARIWAALDVGPAAILVRRVPPRDTIFLLRVVPEP